MLRKNLLETSKDNKSDNWNMKKNDCQIYFIIEQEMVSMHTPNSSRIVNKALLYLPTIHRTITTTHNQLFNMRDLKD